MNDTQKQWFEATGQTIVADGSLDLSDTTTIDSSERIYEEVFHPQHYNDHPSGVECITIVEEFSFNLGSAMKYIWRAGLKPGQDWEKDLRKAIWYIEREIQRKK